MDRNFLKVDLWVYIFKSDIFVIDFSGSMSIFLSYFHQSFLAAKSPLIEESNQKRNFMKIKTT